MCDNCIQPSWKRVSLGDVVILPERQVDPRRTTYRSHILIGPDAVEPETGRLLNPTTAAEQEAISGKYLVHPGDIVYGKIRPTLRKAVLADYEALCSGDMIPLHPTGQIDPRILLAIVLSDRFSRYAAARSIGTGIPRIGRSDITAFQFPLPELQEQRRITEILATIDKQIENQFVVAKKLTVVRDATAHQALAEALLAGSARLDEVASVERGRFTVRPRNDPRFYGGAYPFIQTGDVSQADGSVITRSTQTLNDAGRRVSREFPVGTVAVTIAANIGATAILGRPMWFPDSIVGIVAAKCMHPRFVELCIRRVRASLESRAPQSAQRNINLQDLRHLRIPFPSKETQEQIVHQWESYTELVDRTVRQVSKLRLMKQGLTEDLLSGKVRVPG